MTHSWTDAITKDGLYLISILRSYPDHLLQGPYPPYIQVYRRQGLHRSR